MAQVQLLHDQLQTAANQLQRDCMENVERDHEMDTRELQATKTYIDRWIELHPLVLLFNFDTKLVSANLALSILKSSTSLQQLFDGSVTWVAADWV